MRWSSTLALIAAWAASLAATPSALADSKEVRLRVAFVYKLLSYDRKLRQRASRDVRILLVFDKATAGQRPQLAKLFARLTGREIQGRPISIDILAFSDAKTLAARAKGAAALFLPAGATTATAAALKAADAHRVPVISGQRIRGAALCLPVSKGRAKIVVDLKAARRHRLDLPGPILRLAEVIK